MDETEVKTWEPRYPWLKDLGDTLRTVGESSKIGQFLLEGKADLAEMLAYGDRLTTGKGETTGLKPVAMEGADFLPSPGTLAKGASKAVLLGPIGLMRLDDPKLSALYRKISQRLQGVKDPKDWLSQKAIVDELGGTAIYRGRDMTPDMEHIRFGVELPKGEITEDLLEATRTGKNQARFERIGDNVRLRSPVMTEIFPFEQAYNAPELLRAYPSLKKLTISGDASLGTGNAYIDFGTNRIALGKQTDPSWLDLTMAHEIQHKIQLVENWPQGTNTSVARRLLMQLAETDSAMRGKARLAPGFESPPYVEVNLAKRQADLLRSYRAGHPDSRLAKYGDMLYQMEGGEVLARAGAFSHVHGGGKIGQHVEEEGIPYFRMYDDRLYDDRLKF